MECYEDICNFFKKLHGFRKSSFFLRGIACIQLVSGDLNWYITSFILYAHMIDTRRNRECYQLQLWNHPCEGEEGARVEEGDRQKEQH